jgi:hypothetical protein
MIIATILAIAAGILTGLSADALLRGRDPQSMAVVIWGLFGALVATVVCYFVGPQDVLIVGLSAAVGGMALACAARAHISGQLDRARRTVARLGQLAESPAMIQTRAEVEVALARSR